MIKILTMEEAGLPEDLEGALKVRPVGDPNFNFGAVTGASQTSLQENLEADTTYQVSQTDLGETQDVESSSEYIKSILTQYVIGKLESTKALAWEQKVMLGDTEYPAEIDQEQIPGSKNVIIKKVRFEKVKGEKIAIVDLEVNGEKMTAFQVPQHLKGDVVRKQLGTMVRKQLGTMVREYLRNSSYNKEWLILGKDLVKKDGIDCIDIPSYDPEKKTDIARILAKGGFRMLTLEDFCILAEIAFEILQKPIKNITCEEMNNIGVNLNNYEFGCQDGESKTFFLCGGDGNLGAYAGVFALYLYRDASYRGSAVGFRCVL